MTQTAYTNPNSGLHSIVEASEDYELAPIGIASMKDQAEKLAEFGRYGDVYVVHAAKGETVIPMEVLEANPHIKSLLFNQMEEMGLDPNRYVVGNEFNSLNPVTGMPEFFFKKIFKKVKKAVKKVFKVVKKIAPVAIPIAASFFGFPAFMGSAFAQGTIGAAALGSGLGSLVGGGSIKDALKAAAISGGLAGLGGYLRGGTAGLKASLTGKTPIYQAGKLIGHQVAPSTGEVWKSLTGADGIGGSAQSYFKGTSGTFNPVEGYTGHLPTSSFDPATFRPGIGDSPILPSGTTGLDPTGIPLNSTRFNPDGAPGPAQRAWEAVTGGPDASAVVPGSTVPDPSSGNIASEISRYETELGRALTDAEAFKVAQNAASTTAAAANTGLFGGTGPLGLPEITGSKLADTAIYGGGAYLTADALGAFTPAEGEPPEDTLAGRPDLGVPILTLEERQRLSDEQKLSEDAIDPNLFTPTNPVVPTIFSADGGSVDYPRRELLVEGPGTERSDDIPAMLSDGEFVINSRAVRGADPSGRGNRYAGANNLYNIMRNFEMRA